MITIQGPAISKVDHTDPRFLALVEASARLASKDDNLWGANAREDASIRLNWVDCDRTSRKLLPELDAISARFRAFRRVVLCGMGGSSLAPEVIAATYKKELIVLDSTDSNYISFALKGDLKTTVVVVSSKSGSTIETSSQRSLFESKFADAGLNPTEHMIIVTDPDSPLDHDARQRGYTVVNADPNVGGRYSALTAFGLVPAALLGIDVSILLDSATEAITEFCGSQSAAVSAAYLLSYHCGQYCAFSDSNSGMPGLSDWIEQLIAESTGKDHLGRLPIVIESTASAIGGDAMCIAFSGESDLVIKGDLGAQFIFWEWVTALLGYALGINPFNQPNVTEAKEQTASLLTKWAGELPKFIPYAVEENVEIFATASTVHEALNLLINSVRNDGYIAIMAYLDRGQNGELTKLRRTLAEKCSKPVTFGWGPRFLHSTGQFHKGGQPNGVFLQITGEPATDIGIPGQDFSFNTLIAAQAMGDGQALTSRGYTVIRLHLKNRENGIAEILSAAQAIL